MTQETGKMNLCSDPMNGRSYDLTKRQGMVMPLRQMEEQRQLSFGKDPLPSIDKAVMLTTIELCGADRAGPSLVLRNSLPEFWTSATRSRRQ